MHKFKICVLIQENGLSRSFQVKFLNLETPVGMRLHSSFSQSIVPRRNRYRQPNLMVDLILSVKKN